jgi:CRP-like cAMP-binding protein
MISVDMLRRFPFLSGLAEDQLRGIAMISEEISFPANTVIFKEESQADRFYLIVSGVVELLYSGGKRDRGMEACVGLVTQAEVLGVSALIDPFRLRTGARTRGPVNAVAINAAGLRALCEVDPGLGYNLMRRLAHALFERLHMARVEILSNNPGE